MTTHARRPPSASPLAHRRRSAHGLALLVAVVFSVAGLVWVLFTDVLLYVFVTDPVLIARFETAKGWTFVAFAAGVLYLLTWRASTRLLRTKDTLAAVIESIGDGILLLGSDRRIVHANPAALRILQCARPEELIGMGAEEFVRVYHVAYPDGAVVTPDQLISQRVFDEGGPLHYKAVLHPGDRPEIVISATAAAVREHPREPPSLVVSVLHDITDSEHLEQLRDRFFAAAGHALKTPVAVIKANVQLLASAPPPLRRAAIAIDRQCVRMDLMVQNLLVLARARTQSLELYLEEIELAPLIARAAAAQPARHEVRTEVEASLRVRADEERLAMAIRNLIEEAARSSPLGTAITLTLRRRDGQAEIGVRFPNLPPDERAEQLAVHYEGLGVGRSVAALIVAAHGGSLGEEAADAETILTVVLPTAEGTRGRA